MSNPLQSIDLVRQFHHAFDVPLRVRPGIDIGRAVLRLRLIGEELEELERAIATGSMAGVLHELCDLQYVLDGTFLEFGLAHLKDPALAEIHRANMSKLGADGRPLLRADGKVMKGPNFRAADIAAVLAGGRA